jgi:hypothetical protein
VDFAFAELQHLRRPPIRRRYSNAYTNSYTDANRQIKERADDGPAS